MGHSVLSQAAAERRKTSSKSEGAAMESRKVSFIDELTGMSARPDPKFEQKLQQQLKIVKDAGELGEFVQKPTISGAAGATGNEVDTDYSRNNPDHPATAAAHITD